MGTVMILVLFRPSLFLGPYTVHLFSNTNTWENNYNYDAAHDDDDDDDDADDDDDVYAVYAGGHPPTAASLAVDSVSAAHKQQLGKAMCILQTYCYTHTADKYIQCPPHPGPPCPPPSQWCPLCPRTSPLGKRS